LAVERGREGRGTAGRGGDCAAAPGRLGSERKKKKGKGKGRLTGGAQVSALAGKKKKKRRRGGPARVLADGPLGPSGLKGEPAMFSFFFFFKLHFKPFFFSNSNQTFQTFSQEFYKLFRNHTSNQKPCKPTDDAQTLVVSKFIKLYLIF
jgi:hypothetical protein